MKRKLILILIFVSICYVFFYYKTNFVHAQIEFEKLRPIPQKINVYYNGFKVGRTSKMLPCDTSPNTCVHVTFNEKSAFLPCNSEAQMKQKRINDKLYEDYIEIIYPKNPSYIGISNKTKLKGTLSGGFHNYLNEEVSYSEMEDIKESLKNSVEHLETLLQATINVMDSLNVMINNSEKELTSAAKNLNYSSKKLKSITNKADGSFNQEEVKSIIKNIEGTTKNLDETTGDIKNMTNRLNYSGTAANLTSIAKSSDEIVQGVNCALRKPFGGLRILFGKTIK